MKHKVKTILLVMLVIISALFLLRGKLTHEKFESAKWKNSDQNLEKNWGLRWNMMNSLRTENELIGKSYTEIIKLLGNPDSENQNELNFSLGYNGNGINTSNLTLFIDENRNVVKIKVREG